jgi:hypothetical protein
MKDLWNRASLKNFFKKGQFPSEIHFAYLIDSTINKIDDGFSKTEKNGLQLSPTGDSDSVLSLFKDPVDEHPRWQISLKSGEQGEGLSIDAIGQDQNGRPRKKSSLFLSDSGRIGVGSHRPGTDFHVAGTLGAHTRTGTFKTGSVMGDGNWQDILTDLQGTQAFEVVAKINGPEGRGKYAITHALALSNYGSRNSRIRQTRSYFGWFWNRIEFRWKKQAANPELPDQPFRYKLQVRTRSNYGLSSKREPCLIQYHISRLWDDTLFQESSSAPQ